MPITIHNNETLKGISVRLEEHAFNNCKLIECFVFYDGGPFQWTNTFFDNCQFSFREEAMNTIRVLQTLGMLKEGLTPPPSVSGSSTVN
jgi:hypothetical protein